MEQDNSKKEDIAQTVERKRQEFNAAQDKAGIGTLGGLLGLLKKKREQTSQLNQSDPENPTADSNAK